jgi:hypothetical protein
VKTKEKFYANIAAAWEQVLASCDPHHAPDSLLGNQRAEFEHLPVDCLVADNDATLCQEALNVPVAKSEPEIESDGMSDGVRWKSMPRIGNWLHGLVQHMRRLLVNLPMPQCAILDHLRRGKIARYVSLASAARAAASSFFFSTSTSGKVRSKVSTVITIAAATTSLVNHLLSAGTTNHGACFERPGFCSAIASCRLN